MATGSCDRKMLAANPPSKGEPSHSAASRVTDAPSEVAVTRPSSIHSMVLPPSRRLASKSTSTVYMPMV